MEGVWRALWFTGLGLSFSVPNPNSTTREEELAVRANAHLIHHRRFKPSVPLCLKQPTETRARTTHPHEDRPKKDQRCSHNASVQARKQKYRRQHTKNKRSASPFCFFSVVRVESTASTCQWKMLDMSATGARTEAELGSSATPDPIPRERERRGTVTSLPGTTCHARKLQGDMKKQISGNDETEREVIRQRQWRSARVRVRAKEQASSK